MDISETAAASGLKIGRYKQLIQKMKLLVFKVKVTSCPWPKVIYMKIKTCFSQKPLGHF